MGNYGAVPTLMFATLGVALLIAVILLLRFHKRHDSHPMDGQRERNIDEIRADAPPEH